jgi:hypothetical protein
MDGLAKIISFVLMFFFFMGVYIALSPQFFTKMGKNQAGKVIAQLRNKVSELEGEVAALTDRSETDQRIAKLEKQKRQEAEQKAGEAVRETQQAYQSLEDTIRVLDTTREALNLAESNMLTLEERVVFLEGEVKTTLAMLAVSNDENARHEATIAQLQPLAAIATEAQREVLLYRNGGLILLISLLLGATVFYWKKNRNQGGPPPPFDENSLPGDNAPDDVVGNSFQEEACRC